MKDNFNPLYSVAPLRMTWMEENVFLILSTFSKSNSAKWAIMKNRYTSNCIELGALMVK